MFNTIDQYPMMMPYVGTNYVPAGSKSLLLIGESHYLPADSTQHVTSESWYTDNHTTLSETEELWINTSQIIQISRSEGFKNKAHSIYRNAFWEINQNGPKYDDYKRVADDVVYYNYFRRPALTGKSLTVTQDDIALADRFFREVYAQYRPAAVVFLSVAAYDRCSTCRSLDVPVVVTPHPGTSHWNRATARRDGKKGREILGAAVAALWSKA